MPRDSGNQFDEHFDTNSGTGSVLHSICCGNVGSCSSIALRLLLQLVLVLSHGVSVLVMVAFYAVSAIVLQTMLWNRCSCILVVGRIQ